MTADGMTTRMRFVFSDDVTPNQVTIGNQTASEWVLKQIDPSDSQAGYFWDPVP